jgi:5-methylcytosine-specific restriction endonuclease McrA
MWQSERQKIKEPEIGALEAFFEFDWTGFAQGYELQFPSPVDPSTCEHARSTLRHRIYRKGGDAAVLQCEVCGKHLRAVSKANAPAVNTLEAFDESLPKTRVDDLRRWYRTRHEALENAWLEFRAERSRRIASGELRHADTSRFGTYYASPQRQRTRVRILARDDCKCQACDEDATDVHHITYDRLGCENDLDLIALCAGCHLLVHERQDRAEGGFRLTPCEIRDLHMMCS